MINPRPGVTREEEEEEEESCSSKRSAPTILEIITTEIATGTIAATSDRLATATTPGTVATTTPEIMIDSVGVEAAVAEEDEAVEVAAEEVVAEEVGRTGRKWPRSSPRLVLTVSSCFCNVLYFIVLFVTELRCVPWIC